MLKYALGFTLLEVMVVVLLIGIISSFAVIQFSGPDPEQRVYEETRRLRAVMQQQSEQALLMGQQRGLRFSYVEDQVRVQVVVMDADKSWRTSTDQGSLASYTLPTDISLLLTIDGRVIPFNSDNKTPQLWFLSSGEASEFELEIKQGNLIDSSTYRLQGFINGDINMQAIAANTR